MESTFPKIENVNELRASITLLTNYATTMSNATTTEEVINSFIFAKDVLVEIYKFNTQRVTQDQNSKK